MKIRHGLRNFKKVLHSAIPCQIFVFMHLLVSISLWNALIYCELGGEKKKKNGNEPNIFDWSQRSEWWTCNQVLTQTFSQNSHSSSHLACLFFVTVGKTLEFSMILSPYFLFEKALYNSTNNSTRTVLINIDRKNFLLRQLFKNEVKK